MVNVSQAFHEKIKDGYTRQDFLLVDSVGSSLNGKMWLRWLDGDFSADGIEIHRAVNEATDMTLGECPAATISFKLMDPYNDLLSWWDYYTNFEHTSWTWARAFVGVLLNSEAAPPGMSFADITIVGSDTGLTVNGVQTSITEKVNGVHVVNWSNTLYWANVYCENTVYGVWIDLDGTVAAVEDNTSEYPIFMLRRMREHPQYIYQELNGTGVPKYIWHDGVKEEWEYCILGTYKLPRPKNTLDVELTVADAFDKMAEFDRGLYETWTGLPTVTWPQTVGNIATQISTLCGVSYISSDTTPVSRNPFSDNTTCRQVMKWAAERGGKMLYASPLGTLEEWYPVFANPVTFVPSQIEEGSYSIEDYQIPVPDALEVRTTDDKVYAVGTGDNLYTISGNPFFEIGVGTWPTVATVSFPQYDPVTFRVIDADPSFGYGDCFTVTLMDRQGQNVIKNGFVMRETLTFDGRVHAEYESSGNEVRQVGGDYQTQNLQTVSNKAADFFSSGGWIGFRMRNYLIISRVVDITGVDVTFPWGNVFTGNGISASVPQIEYPVTFIETPTCVAQMVSTGGSDGWLSTATDYTTQDLKHWTPAYELNRGTARTGISFSVHYYVMGLLY